MIRFDSETEKKLSRKIVEEEMREILKLLNQYVYVHSSKEKDDNARVKMKEIKLKIRDKLERIYKFIPPEKHQTFYYEFQAEIEKILYPRNPTRKLLF